ncbi:DUF6887 family protein [Leptolyngbya sp. 7M]|uniref:DUF6887 family protein n=1 Tax=Leptolyngbya sp. 7M TaxID=2812896 RepID=UPI001B8B800F|nr:hypothetical protein [Leptolyngbya sp. 7M]QYO64556.1 hypothetical protein JVX88_33720 [Leptolyngbya sp. 7M]
MSQPDFHSMNRKALIAYLLEHREDQQAFYALMDKLATEPVLATLPPVFSSEEAEQENFAELLKEINKRRNLGQAS